MWNGTVRSLPLREQVRAASLAGCEALSITPAGVARWSAEGITTQAMRSIAADAGVRLFHLDPLIRWVEHWQPDLPAGAFPYEALSSTESEFFAMAEALGVESFTVWGAFPEGTLTFNQIVDAFGALCARAAARGLRCWLEFLPMYGITCLAQAWAIVAAAAAPNSGLVFDFWHYFRGRPDDDLLRSIPSGKIAAVQICDATASPPPGVPLGRDGQMSRRLPGEGDFRIADIMRILETSAALDVVGLEIFSTKFDAMTADQIGAACRQSLASVLRSPLAANSGT